MINEVKERFYIHGGEILDCGFFLGSNEEIVKILNKQDQHIAELEEEIVKFQEQLTNAIVPKYKPCDYVYAITPRRAKKIQKCFVYKVEIEPIAGYLSISYLVIELGDNESVSDLKESGEDWFYSKFAEKALFTTEAEAQKHLEERK